MHSASIAAVLPGVKCGTYRSLLHLVVGAINLSNSRCPTKDYAVTWISGSLLTSGLRPLSGIEIAQDPLLIDGKKKKRQITNAYLKDSGKS